MKITVVRGGGIAGLVTTTSADSTALAPADAEALRARVEGARLWDLPTRLTGPTSLPDAFDYQIIVEDGGRTKTLSVAEDAVSPSLRSLVEWLGSVPGHEDTISPPGF